MKQMYFLVIHFFVHGWNSDLLLQELKSQNGCSKEKY